MVHCKCWLSIALGSVLMVGAASAQAPKWDRVAHVKEVAVHIGTVQRRQGADQALAFIDACYRTHSLGSTYSKAFEGCIVADYLLAQALVAVTNRVPAEDRARTGLVGPDDIIKAVQTRMGAAFGQYAITKQDANALVAVTAQHGMPAFLRAVFPNAAADDEAKP